MKNIYKNLFYLFLPLAVGLIISLIIRNTVDYQMLVKPPLAPPGFLFPIIWTIIYLLMGLSYYLLNKNDFVDNQTKKTYYTQLIVNALWSIIFFVFKFRLLACFWIVILDILVSIMIYKFYNIKKISAYLNILYLLWCLFATYLTISIYVLN